MPLVEVVPYPGTSQSALQVAIGFYKACGKTPVHIKEEIPEFAANRLQNALLEEAYSLVNGGILTTEEVETCVTNSLAIRWAITGPFTGNVFGGGQGGFKHLTEHVGASSQAWGEDVKAHQFHATSDTIDKLDASV
jgi:3-hydroxyacyl-CoA dehydrogenase